jgi:hypothetical protein
MTFFKDFYIERYETNTAKKKKEQLSLASNKKGSHKDAAYSNVTSLTKMHDVCSRMIDACQKSGNDTKYFLVVLTCYAKMKELDNALYKIVELGKSMNSRPELVRAILS